MRANPTLVTRDTGIFSRLARWVARTSGRSPAFGGACLIIVLWGLSGPLFAFSDTWQLVVNTGTTIVTFLMVFLIQNTQYRDSEAMHIKLDELLRAVDGAHNSLLDLEELTQDDIDRIRSRYSALARKARQDLRQGRKDTNKREVEA